MNVVNVARYHNTLRWVNVELYKYNSQHGVSNSNIRYHNGGNNGKKGKKVTKHGNKKLLVREILAC